MSRIDPLVVSYATWLAGRPGPRNEADFHPIIRRLDFECLMDIRKMVSDENVRFDEVFPMLNPRKYGAFVAIAKYVSLSETIEPSLLSLLEWSLGHIPEWTVSRFVNKTTTARDWTLSVLKMASLDPERQENTCKNILVVVEKYCQAVMKESTDLEECSKAICGILDGLIAGISYVSPSVHIGLIKASYGLLQSGIFDLAEFLKDCPQGSNVDEILQRHYFLLKSVLAFMHSLFNIEGFQIEDDCFAEIRSLLLGYFRESTQFLLHTSSDEPFLFQSTDLIARICSFRVNMEVGDFILSVMQAAASSGPMNSFVEAIESCCVLLYKCASDVPSLQTEALKSLKMLLGNLSQYDGPRTAVAIIGKYLGKVLKLLIDAGQSVFCESFVSNLAVELPSDTLDVNSTFTGIINALGNISLHVENEKISRICLSTLIAQYKKSANNRHSEIFFEQFNLIAASGPSSYLSSVLDIYIAKYMEDGSTHKQLQTITTALKALVQLTSSDPIKSETILQSVLRLFVDKGLTMVKAHNEKLKKKPNETFVSPIELEYLLPVVGALLAESKNEKAINKAARLEAFQEFWFLFIFTGYQTTLAWPESWAKYIPTISLATPVLIKEKDRLKAVTTPLSQVLLSQSANAQMKTQLMSLMPNCTYLAKTLTLPKCLWLLSVFFSETQKLEHGNLHDLMIYMSSEVVKQFELDAFIEDLLTTVFKRWLPDASSGNQEIIDNYACQLLEYCGHGQERVHNFALRFLKMILDNHRQTYSCHRLWEAFLEKINQQYEISRRALGEETLSDASVMAMNPLYGKASFENLVSLARTIFAAASAEYPHDFYAFIQKNLHKQQVFFEGRPGDRDIRMLELLRICLPLSTEAVPSYLGLALEFRSKPEDYIKWLLCRGHPNAACQDTLSVLYDSKTSAHVGCLTDATKKLLENSSVFDLESVVAYPFSAGTAEAFKEAVYCWAWILDERPELLSSFLSLVGQSWASHVKLAAGAFRLDPSPGVFRSKMDASETHIKHIKPQSSPAVPYIILVDFLHERLLLSARSDQSTSIKLLYQIIVQLLEGMLQFCGIPRLRAAILKASVLSFEFLRQFQASLSPDQHCIIRSHLYKLMIHHLGQPHNFIVEDGDFMKYEEGLLLKMRNFFDEERGLLGQLATTTFGSPSASLLPNSDSLAETAGLLRMLLTNELESMQIWHNRLRSRQTYLDSATVNEYISVAIKYSAPLAVQVASRFTYALKDQTMLAIFERNRSHVHFDDPETVAFWLLNNLSFGNIRSLITAPPLHIISAISVFISPKHSANPMIVNYAMRSMEMIKPETLYFYIPHIVQALRHDQFGYIERTIMHVARTSSLFAHQIIWNMKANTYQDDLGTIPDPFKHVFEEMIEKVSRLMAGIDREFFEREFAFFDKVTAISGALKPYVKKEKWEKKAKIDEELRKVAVDPGVYLPSNPESIVIDIDYDSGRPLQSHAKAPYMATFRVKSSTDPEAAPIWQSVIFKVGDDCRQDVLALQFLTAIKNIFESVNLNLYFFPYRVVATGPGCGVIEVIPNSISRDQLGREKINSLYDYFCFKFGNERSPKFAQARENFVKSMAAYSIACYLLAIKDRHNGNIMVSDAGHIIHIDFGFILDLSPGGISVESPFKLTTEMLTIMGGRDDSAPYFAWFRELCCQGFLALRTRADQLIQLVECMSESGLPCFGKGEAAIRKLRNRFRLDLSEADARQFFYDLVYKSCETIRTALYDKYQEKTNGIPY